MVRLEMWRTSKLRGSFHKHSCAEDYWVELTASKLDFSQSRGGGHLSANWRGNSADNIVPKDRCVVFKKGTSNS